MKKENKNRMMMLFAFVLAMLCIASCDDAQNYAITDNQAYILGGFSEKFSSMYAEGVNQVPITVPVMMTRKDDTRDVKVKLEISEAALDAFNKRYNKDYVMYPECELLSDEVTINKGVVGAGAILMVTPITKELDETGDTYAVPVTITSADGIGIMKGSETFIYLIRRIPRASVFTFNQVATSQLHTRKIFFPLDMAKLNNQLEFTAYTMEFLLKFTNWSNGNNYDLINPTMGPEVGEIYTRLEGGSAGLAAGVFNVKFNGDGESIAGQPPGGTQLNRWYHVAFVFGNGKLQVYVNAMLTSQMDVTLPSLNFTPAVLAATEPVGFLLGAAAANSGYSSRVRARTQAAEVRLWSVARTADQIRENMYNVRPDSEGLMGYWKLNDGSGRYVKDYTGKNPDGYLIRVNYSGTNNNTSFSTLDDSYNQDYAWDNTDQVLLVN